MQLRMCYTDTVTKNRNGFDAHTRTRTHACEMARNGTKQKVAKERDVHFLFGNIGLYVVAFLPIRYAVDTKHGSFVLNTQHGGSNKTSKCAPSPCTAHKRQTIDGND